jgi:DNA gyrase/topoisomerase IV subunit A
LDNLAFEVIEKRLDSYAIANIKEYGKYTIEERALPDYRDALKPVQRRSLWSAHTLGINSKSGYKKSARVVGDVIAKYHPHGDVGVYGAIVNMVNDSQPLFDGSGNFGSINTSPAAYRYTEMRLSAFADATLFSKPHLDVIELVNNYDGSEKEPLVLPALLPNLLLNGVQGMAVGVTVGVPPFTPKSLNKILQMVFQKETVTHTHLNKILKLNYKFGGQLLDVERLKLFYTTGQSAITLLPDYTYDADNYRITITGGGPNFECKWAIEKLQEFDIVTSVNNFRSDGKIKLIVHLRRNDEAAASVELLMRKLSDSLTLRFNLTERLSHSDPRFKADVNEVEFFASNITDYLQLWAKWRLELETKTQLNIAENLEKKIKQTDLLILAANNLDLIFKELKAKKDNLIERLAATLRITKDEAAYLAQRAIGSFAALNTNKLIEANKENVKAKKTAISIANKPRDHVVSITDKLMDMIKS